MRVFNYLFVMVGLMFLFGFAGVGVTSNIIVNILGGLNPSGFGNSQYYLTAIAALTALVVGGIFIGTLTKSSTESFILLAYAGFLLTFVIDIIGVTIYMYNNSSKWMASLMVVILMPIAVGYVHSVLSWWGGKD